MQTYVDSHISWLSSLSFWVLPGMAAHRATVSEKGCEVGLYLICCFKPKLKDNFYSFTSWFCWNKLVAFKGIENKNYKNLWKFAAILSNLKARFLAKLHRRRFDRACVAHPWDAQAQLVRGGFPGVAGPNSGEVKTWWIRHDVILKERKAISSLKA